MMRRGNQSERGSISSDLNQGLAPCSPQLVVFVPVFSLLAFQSANRVRATRANDYKGGVQAVFFQPLCIYRANRHRLAWWRPVCLQCFQHLQLSYLGKTSCPVIRGAPFPSVVSLPNSKIFLRLLQYFVLQEDRTYEYIWVYKRDVRLRPSFASKRFLSHSHSRSKKQCRLATGAHIIEPDIVLSKKNHKRKAQ